MISAKTSLSRAALRGGAATFAIALLSVSAVAQAQTTTTTTAAAEEINDEGTIVVTGTLINNPNLVSSTPIVTRSADVIQLQASNTAESVIRDIPGVVPSIGAQVNNGNGGASFVNLRGIGEERNLVLLNGGRITPAGLLGAVDLNNIPLAMIERVDVSTGAAVTTYGADAIAGVVNFVTKRDFTGVDLQLSSGITEVGDGATFRADLTIGGNFADGRGNAVVSVGYQTADPVYQGTRAFSAQNQSSFSPTFGGGSGTTVPARFTNTRGLTAAGVPNTTPQFTQTGTIAGPIVDGQPTTIRVLAPVTGGAANGGFRQPTVDNTALGPFNRSFNFNPYNVFQTPFERFNIFAQANYEISDAVEVYSRGLFSKNNVKTIIAPSGLFTLGVDVPLANPFLNDTYRGQFCARNIAPNAVGKDAAGKDVAGQLSYVPLYTPTECARGAAGGPAIKNQLAFNADGTPKLDPATGLQQTEGVEQALPTFNTSIGRRTPEYGPRQSSYTTTIFDYTAGLRGPVTDSISWDLSGAYGESSNQETITGYVINPRAQEALLATNPNTCLSGNPLCVPLNIFGPLGSIDTATAGFITTPATTTRSTSLLQVNGQISGDAGFTVPWATEQVAFALGGDYRKYTAKVEPDAIAEAGDLGGGGGPTPRVDGAYSVQEVFGEVILPVVQDKPFFENLVVEGGLRYSAYSVEAAGNPSFDTLSWKVGGNWEIGGGFKIRGNYTVANRAPNIGELFQPLSQGLTSIGSDPCAGSAPIGNATLTAVCIAQGATAGQIGFIDQPTAGQGNATQGGNVNLKPENATTWTVGAVYQPTFAPGLSVTFDYFNINITDAITQPTSGDALAACFDNPSVANPGCQTIRRNPGTGSFDADSPGLLLATSNLGAIFTDGVDLTLNYSHNLGWANLGVIGNFNYVFSNTFQATPTSVNRECVGYFSPNCGSIQPQYSTNLRVTLGFDWVDVSVLWRHLSGNIQEPLNAAPLDEGGDDNAFLPQFATIDAYDYVDLTGRFHVVENLDVILTIQNLFNALPPITGADAGSTAYNSGNTFPSTYDPLGRRYTMQVVFKF